jgi:hypothetical protein
MILFEAISVEETLQQGVSKQCRSAMGCEADAGTCVRCICN